MASLGIGQAAGAFAQNYAAALGLRSRLDSEAQQQELTNIKIQRERDFDTAQKEMAQLHSNFLNPDYDLASGKPFEQPQGGIADPSKPRPPTNPYTDMDRVNVYYDKMTPLLERQAFASGKGNEVLNIRKTVEDLRKSRYMERLGESLARIEAGDEGGFKQLAGVYKLHNDGRDLVSGKFNEDGTITLSYNENGEAKEQVTTFDKLSNMAKSALNLADTVKLRHASQEAEKDRKFKTSERVAGQEFTSGEHTKDRTFRAEEGKKDREFRAEESKLDRQNRSAMNDADNTTRVGIADKQIAADKPNRDAKSHDNRVVEETHRQTYFDREFDVDSKFAPKNESELKNLFGEQKTAYERDLKRWGEGRKLSQAAKTFSSINPDTPMASISRITRQIAKGEMDVHQESDGDKRRFVTYQGKRVYLD